MPHDRAPIYSSPRATPVEVVRLVEAEPDPAQRALLAVLYGCALRTSEARALRWSDLTGVGASARLAVGGRHGHGRSVPVPAFTLRHIEAVRPAITDGELIFPSPKGKHLTEDQVMRVVRNAGRRVGRPDIWEAAHLRGLRARHLIASGMSERDVGIFLGSLAYEACQAAPDLEHTARAA